MRKTYAKQWAFRLHHSVRMTEQRIAVGLSSNQRLLKRESLSSRHYPVGTLLGECPINFD